MRKKCDPSCRFFICLVNKLERGMCLLTNEPCVPAKCVYAQCSANRLLIDGSCGFSNRKKQWEDTPHSEDDLPLRVRKKLRRFKDLI